MLFRSCALRDVRPLVNGYLVDVREPGRRADPSATELMEVAMAEAFEGEAYCVKCKAKKSPIDRRVEEKNGRRMGKGKCPDCGTTVVRILGKA